MTRRSSHDLVNRLAGASALVGYRSRVELDDETLQLLRERNRDDLALIEALRTSKAQ